MIKTLIPLSCVIISFFTISCNSSSEEESNEIANNSNSLIGDWKISKYVFINNSNGQEIGSTAPECSGKNLYQLKANNLLNICMYKNVYGGACLDTPTNDDGVWSYNSSTQMIGFYGDIEYKVKSITTSQLQIESFDEGYVDYYDKDYNGDGVIDKVITILIKQ